MFGTIVNVVAVVFGSMLGLMFKKGIPTKAKDTIMQGIGLVVVLIGLKMGFGAGNELVVILSLVIGAILGELIGIDRGLNRLAEHLHKRAGGEEGAFIEGFVSASLIFCVGAMAIMGALEAGLTGSYQILYAKSALDFITSMIFASTFGIGVMFSALPILIYQGAITLLASSVRGVLTDSVVSYMTATGGLLILGIGINILFKKDINIANLRPAIFVAVFVTMAAIALFPGFV